MVNFWYINCGPCIIEMPVLNQLVEDYKESDINFLSFSFDKKEDLEILEKALECRKSDIEKAENTSDEYFVKLLGEIQESKKDTDSINNALKKIKRQNHSLRKME